MPDARSIEVGCGQQGLPLSCFQWFVMLESRSVKERVGDFKEILAVKERLTLPEAASCLCVYIHIWMSPLPPVFADMAKCSLAR